MPSRFFHHQPQEGRITILVQENVAPDSQVVVGTALQEKTTLRHQDVHTSQMEEEVTILVEQNEAPAFQVVVAVAILCKQDFSYANQVGDDATLRQQDFL